MTYTKLAIAEFVETYGDLKEKKGFEGPSADELFEMMSQEILGKSYDPNSEAKYEQFIESGKNLREDEEETTESVGEVESVESTVEVEESKSVAKENPKKINAKDLKNFTVKENKQGKNGEMKEVDVMIELPYLPHCVDYSGTCQAIKFNGGLMTPCLTRPAKGSSYCRSCVKELKYGTLESRNNVEIGSYQVTCENEDGKKQVKREISYGTWLLKRSIDRTYVEKLLEEKFGDSISIPENYFEVNKSKARRSVKKSPSVSSDGETSSVEGDESVSSAEKTEKKRGRPKKEKSGEESPKKRRGRPPAKKKEIVEETLETIENNPAIQEIFNFQEEKNEVKEQPEAEPEKIPEESSKEPVVIDDELVEDEISDIESDNEDEDENETYFMYKGKKMCYDEENTLFMFENDVPSIVGTWDPEEEKPIFDDGVEL